MFQIADDAAAYSFGVPWMGATTRWLLKRLLLSENITWWMHNSAYDQQVFQVNLGVMARNVRDSMAEGLGITEQGEQVGLKALSRVYKNAPYYERELNEACESHRNVLTWKTGPLCECHWYALAKYGAYDAWNTRELGRILPSLVDAEGTRQLVDETLLPALQTFAPVELHGCYIDVPYSRELEAEWLPLLQQAESELKEYAREKGFPQDPSVVGAQTRPIPCPLCTQPLIDAGELPASIFPSYDRKFWREVLRDTTSFGDPSCTKCMKRRFVLVQDTELNPRSPKQMQHLAHDILGLYPLEDKRSTDANFFKYWESHELSKKVMALRERDHLLRTYVYGIVDDVWTDGRAHPDFLLFGAVNGRLSVKNPPVQTLPKWGVADPKMAKLVRKLFAATPGFVIVDADFKNLELFTSAMLSGDEELYRALTEADFHTTTAAAIFSKGYPCGLDLDEYGLCAVHGPEVTGLDRFNSKFVTFGIAYGRQAWSLSVGELAEIIASTQAELHANGEYVPAGEEIAQAYIDRLWAKYPKWKAAYDKWQYDALEYGELTTPFGRKRRWRLITPDNINQIRNQAVNFPPASTASDINLHAMIRLQKRLTGADLGFPLFPVHDSIVFEVREDRVDEAAAMIEEEMTAPPPFETAIKLQVEIDVGYNLGEVVSYDKWKAGIRA
jgi:DNA polymerase I-like protein with 3'-5' exonuclease and polymerase domains